jgi:septal ring factor EnvC (AmiA/AmiB activator)
MAQGMLIMAVFTSVLQLAGSGATRQKDIDTEIKRQKAICDEIKNTKPKLDRIKDLYTEILKTKNVTDDNDKLISDLNDDVSAFNAQVDDLRKAGRQKMLILLVINIVVVAFLSVYIVM